MLETQALIIGGGPAGSTLASALTQAGIHTVIMDKANFPRDKVCAGWVTPEVMQALQINLEDYARDLVLQPIHGFRTGQIGQPPVQSNFPGLPVSFGIRRVEFDNYLLRRCGAELQLGQAFKTVQRDGNSWIVNNAIKTRLLVGAGGHFCPVARFIGAKGSRETVVAAQEIEFEMNPEQQLRCPVDRNMPELFFTSDLKGYGWVFRKGNHLNIGLGREDRHGLSGHVGRFCDYLTQIGRIPEQLPGKLKGHAYVLYPHAKRQLVEDGIILIGDAAGLAYAQSGEGIRPAVESALLAAQVVQKCQGDYSAVNLRAYVDELEKRFGRRQPPRVQPGRRSPQLRQLLVRLLMRNHWFSRNLLIRRCFLRSHAPPLPAAPGLTLR